MNAIYCVAEDGQGTVATSTVKRKLLLDLFSFLELFLADDLRCNIHPPCFFPHGQFIEDIIVAIEELRMAGTISMLAPFQHSDKKDSAGNCRSCA